MIRVWKWWKCGNGAKFGDQFLNSNDSQVRVFRYEYLGGSVVRGNGGIAVDVVSRINKTWLDEIGREETGMLCDKEFPLKVKREIL